MKILAIGDFHGKFPQELKKIAKSKEIDLIISVGDYPPWELKKEFFKHCYKTKKDLWDVVGKTKYKKSFLKDQKVGEEILKFLNSLNKPILAVPGNYDHIRINDQYPKSFFNEKWTWAKQDLN